MATCESCGTSLFWQDDVTLMAGQSGVLHDGPALFGLGDTVFLAPSTHVTPIGHARYDYGRGWWDEFFCVDQAGDHGWLSVDEGDLVYQVPLPRKQWPTIKGKLRVARELSAIGDVFRITELSDATCIGVMGTFDEVIAVGDVHSFVNAKSDDGSLLSGEIWAEGQAWFLGRWFDPFDIHVEHAA